MPFGYIDLHELVDLTISTYSGTVLPIYMVKYIKVHVFSAASRGSLQILCILVVSRHILV